MRVIVSTVVILAVLLCLPVIALADWSENFDTYPVGSPITGQGGWENWGLGSDAYVSDFVSRSPSNSLEVAGSSDVVHRYTGYTSNKWLYKTWVYIPSNFSGISYFILLNTFSPPSYAWSVQFNFDSADGLVHCDCGLDPGNVDIIPYVTGVWSEIRVYIDLDEDWTQIFYDGVLLDDPGLPDHPTLGGGYPWTEGVFGGESNPLNIGAVDLYAHLNPTEIYYDDMSLEPAYAWANVRVDQSAGTRIDYAIVAGRDAGAWDVDAWMVLRSPIGYWSYDGLGTPLGWNSGLGNPVYTGPLSNSSGTSLDIPSDLPWPGNYNAIVGVDTIPNGLPNPSDALLMDLDPFVVP